MNTFQRFKRAACIRGNHEQMLAELDSLYNREQALRPIDVLTQARSKKSALHDHFEWDNKAAAEAYRLRQAGDIIRAVVTVNVDAEGEREHEVRALVAVTFNETAADEDEPTRAYIRMDQALQSKPMLDQVMAAIVRDINAFERKWQHINDLAEVHRAMRDWRERRAEAEMAVA